jgi:pimeloyl-ACP methyl ester carboxylesterase
MATKLTRQVGWAVVFALLAAAGHARAAEARLVKIETPRGASQSFILLAPTKPLAALILFAGGHGALHLTGPSSMRWGAGNFLVRTREMFAEDGFAVAVVDTPSDRPRGMTAVFRMSGAHAADIDATAAYLKKKWAVPVWLVGTSMGTFSAANGAIAGHADGLVLTSTITHSHPRWKIAARDPTGVAGMALARVTVPTLIVANRDDGCAQSPPAGAALLKRNLTGAKIVKVVMLKGGWPPRSRACGAKAPHGYYGIQKKAVSAIADFIKANLR